METKDHMLEEWSVLKSDTKRDSYAASSELCSLRGSRLRGVCSEMQPSPSSPSEAIVGVLGVSIMWLEDMEEEEQGEEEE
ncbi:hypothetical protein E2C01_004864 [Portunus trituberculatus]|uniref:Uncharacterized protein n=1 Tax=Portunus trituberculatus TaxID=210409 RepID=A0A5B7CSH2_PORTR|nr:hypothetical protein [Portunus trituberculatus]